MVTFKETENTILHEKSSSDSTTEDTATEDTATEDISDNNNETNSELKGMCTTIVDLRAESGTSDDCKENGKKEEHIYNEKIFTSKSLEGKKNYTEIAKGNEIKTIKENDFSNHIDSEIVPNSLLHNENINLSNASVSEVDNISKPDSNCTTKEEVKRPEEQKSHGKQKWKMKIRVAGMTLTNTKSAKNWEVVETDSSTKESLSDVEAEVESKDETKMEFNVIENENKPEMTLSPKREKRKIKRKSYTDEFYTSMTLQVSSAKKKKVSGIMSTATKSSTPAKAKGGIRSDCPPFCKTNCSYNHNPLLVFARRMIENDSNSTLVFLDHVTDYYGDEKGDMKPSDLIYDPWKRTNFPLLHYIALMGKCSGCFAMIDAGHQPEKVLTEDDDTVLHTLIKEMYTFNCTHGHMDILVKKFNILLCEFKNCMFQANKKGQTPMHLCAELIANTSQQLTAAAGRSKPPFRLYQFQKNMLISLLDTFQSDEIDSSNLDMKDNEGNTISHYLANDRASISMLERIKGLGADFSICNKDGVNITTRVKIAPPAPPSDLLDLAAFSAKGKKYKSVTKRPTYSPVTNKRNVKTSSTVKETSTTIKRSERIASKVTLKEENLHSDQSDNTLKDTRSTSPTSSEDKTLDTNTAKIVISTVSTKAPMITMSTVSTKAPIKSPFKTVNKPIPILPKTSVATSTISTVTSATKTQIVKQKRNDVIKEVITNNSQKGPVLFKSTVPSSKYVIDVSPSMVTLPKTTAVTPPVSPTVTVTSSVQHQSVIPSILNQQLITTRTRLDIRNPLIPTKNNIHNLSKIVPAEPQNVLPSYQQKNKTSNFNANKTMNISYPPNKTIVNNTNIIPTNVETPLIMKTPDGKLMAVNVFKVSKQNNTINPILSNTNIRQPQQPIYQPARMPMQNNGPLRMMGAPPRFRMSQASCVGMNNLQMGVFPTSIPSPTIGQMQFAQLITSAGQIITKDPHFIPIYGHNISKSPYQQQQQHQHFIQQPQHFIQQPQHFIQQPQHLQQQPQHLRQQRPLSHQVLLPKQISSTGNPPNADQTMVKKSKSLEASIRNIHSNLSEQNPFVKTSKQLPLTNPARETAPPVFIIDTEEELNNPDLEMARNNMLLKQSSPKLHESPQSKKKLEQQNVTEKDDVTRCKYQVEVNADYCQELEKYLVQKKIFYNKLECIGHHDNKILPLNNISQNEKFEQSRINNLVYLLKNWFRSHQTACLEEFSDCVLSQSPVYLSNMLNMRLLPTMKFEEEIWLKIENFLEDEKQQEVFLGSSVKENANTYWNEGGLVTQTEVDTLARKLKEWLQQHSVVSQANFAKKILNRSQGTVSNLIRWRTLPTSKSGEGVWLKIKQFLEDSQQQETLLKSCKSTTDSDTAFLSPTHKGDNLSTYVASRSNSLLPDEFDSMITELNSWLNNHKGVTRSVFAERVLYTSVEMLNNILQRKCKPPEYLSIIRNFLNDSKHQDQMLLYIKSTLNVTRTTIQPSTASGEPPDVQIHKQNSGFSNVLGIEHENIGVIVERLEEWLQENPMVSQSEFAKVILKKESLEEDFTSRNLLEDLTEEGKELLPYVKEFLDSEEQQNALRSLCMNEPFENAIFTQENINDFAEQLKQWLQNHPSVKQSAFAKKILDRSQGSLSNLLRWRTVPTSKQGEAVWVKIKQFLESSELQEKLLRCCTDLCLERDVYNQPQSSSVTAKQESTLSPPPTKKPAVEFFEQHHPYDFVEYPPSELIGQAEVNTLAELLKDWFYRNPTISQVRFAKHVLRRAQGTLSQLLKLRTAPTSKMGEKVWLKIKEFLTNTYLQDVLLNECGGPHKLKECACRSNNDTENVVTPSFYTDEAVDIPINSKIDVDWSESSDHCSQTSSSTSTTTNTLKPVEEFVLGKHTIEMLADELKAWLENHIYISQGFFANKVLSRSQGTLSALLKWRGIPTSKSGHAVWYKIKNFLEDEHQQQTLLASHKQWKMRGFKEDDIQETTLNKNPAVSVTNAFKLTQADINKLSSRIKEWLYINPSVGQNNFSKYILHLKQGSFSCLLKNSIMPKSPQGEEVWLKIRHFLQDEVQQCELLDLCNKTSEDEALKWSRKELSILDEYFIETDGILTNGIIEMLAEATEKTKEQVSYWFANHRQREKDGLYRPGMYSIPQTVENNPAKAL